MPCRIPRIGAARSWAAAVKRKGKDHFPRNTLKNNAIGAIGNLDFVASGFDFVAFGFDFVAPGLGFVAAGLVFVVGA
jgi:hypothetical protein